MRRTPGALLAIEVSRLDAGVELGKAGTPELRGYLVARRIRDREDAKRLTAHGTLYRALDRMETAGLLKSRWEGPALAAVERRPRRRECGVAGHQRRRSVLQLRLPELRPESRRPLARLDLPARPGGDDDPCRPLWWEVRWDGSSPEGVLPSRSSLRWAFSWRWDLEQPAAVRQCCDRSIHDRNLCAASQDAGARLTDHLKYDPAVLSSRSLHMVSN